MQIEGGAVSIRRRKKRGYNSPGDLRELMAIYSHSKLHRTYLLPRFAPSFAPQDVAAYIKKEFDKKHNPTWCELYCRPGWLYRETMRELSETMRELTFSRSFFSCSCIRHEH